MRIEEDAFIPRQGHLLWSSINDDSFAKKLVPGQGYRSNCKIFSGGAIRFGGQAFVKLRKSVQEAKSDSLVVLVPYRDLGELDADAHVEINEATLVAE